MTCLRRRPIPFACSLALALLASAPPAAAQQDEALVGRLARLLAAADARRYDAAVLRDALRDPDPAVRRQGALAAARIHDAAALDDLLPLLTDTSDAVRAAVAFALGQLGDERAVSPLIGLIRAAQGASQAEGVTALARIGGDRAAVALRDALASGPSPAASAALIDAWRLGVRAPVADLVNAAQAQDAETRWRALYSLGRLRVRQGLTPLLVGLQDPDPAVRAVAARGAVRAQAESGGVDPRSVSSRLRTLLLERDANVRINALRALATYRDSGLAEAVAPLAVEADPGVAVQAAATLGALGGRIAVATLRGRLASSAFAVRRQAVIALAQADSAAARSVADSLVRDADWRWRAVAAETFAAARSRARLEALLSDSDGRVVGHALQGLSELLADGDSSAHAAARRLLEHDDPVVRSLAADQLARAPSVADVERLVAAYRRAGADPINDAALSAVRALGKVAALGAAGRLAVADKLLVLPRPADYLVRRAAAEALPDARDAWGAGGPIETGRSEADYRDIVRRWLVPALEGQPAPIVTIETDRGVVTVALLPVEAPLTVGAFLALVEQRYFDGQRWHRVVPNFVVQAGDPRGDGWGGPGFVLRDEVNPVRYETGTMGMALSGPDTGGSQFFITHSPQPHLDGTYTVFGRVTGGSGVLGTIAQGDRIRSIHR
jgi:peptidylprolyl isomerase